MIHDLNQFELAWPTCNLPVKATLYGGTDVLRVAALNNSVQF